MKPSKYILALLCTLMSTLLSAQVMHVYTNNYGDYKEYMADYDSIVYVPETDYNITASDPAYSVDASNNVHAKLSITTGAQTTTVRALLTTQSMSEQLIADIYRGTASGTKTLKGGTTAEVDFTLPDPNQTYTLYVVTGNIHYTKVKKSNKEDYLYCGYYINKKIKYDTSGQTWSAWYSTKAEWIAAGMKADAWPLSESQSTCSYAFGVMLNTTQSGLPIAYRAHKSDTSKGQFRISHWGAANRQLIIDYNTSSHQCIIYPQQIAPDTDQQDYVRDVDQWQGGTGAFYGSFPCTYNPKTGEFSLWLQYYMQGGGNYGFANETCNVDGFYISDYTLEATYSRLYTDGAKNDYAVLNVSKIGKDVTKALATVISTEYDAEAVADAIMDGDLDCVELKLGENNIPVSEEYTDEMQIVICVLDKNKLVDVKQITFEYYHNGETPWVSLGIGAYTEGLFSNLYGLPADSYNVEIQEHKNKPGLYRLMDPYGQNWPYKASNKMKPCAYIEINACDPDGVYILPQMIGVDIEGGAELGIASYGGYQIKQGNKFETLKSNGQLGTLKDGIITLPNMGTAADPYRGVCYYRGSWRKSLSEFKIVLPSAMSKSPRASKPMIKPAKLQLNDYGIPSIPQE